MKKTLFQKVLCLILSVTTLLSVFAFSALAAAPDAVYDTNKDTASSLEDMESLVGVSTYEEYMLENANNKIGDDRNIIKIDVLSPIWEVSNGKIVANSKDCMNSMQVTENWENFEMDGADATNTFYLPSLDETTWTFNVPDNAQGYYYIKIEYFACNITDADNGEGTKSSISSIERKLLIDGSSPYKESSYITLGKTWEFDYISETEPVAVNEKDGSTVEYKFMDIDEHRQAWCKVVRTVKGGMMTETVYKISQDINSNSMLPVAEQVPTWNTYYCQDSSGYYQGFLQFFLHEGTHQFTLEAEREPMIIKSIELVPVLEPVTITEVDGKVAVKQNDLPSYAEILEEYKKMGYYKLAENGKIIELQAEFPDLVSDSSVAATNDNTSAINYPVSSNSQLYNVIGENSYSAVGQWAAYKFKVTETGLYNLAMRFKQDALQGMYICRTVKIHGGHYGEADGTPEVPFAEAYQSEVNYDQEWQSTFVSKDDT